MEKRKVPLEKDIDIELEYRIYSLYDRIRKRWKFVLGIVLSVFLLASGYYYKKTLDMKKKEEASVLIVGINEKLSKEDTTGAQKVIEEFEKRYRDTDYKKVVLAYKILLQKEKGIDDTKSAEELKESLSTELKSGLKEYLAYVKYKNGKIKEAKESLLSIEPKDYNYFSGRMLLGFIYKKESDLSKAQEMFKSLSNSKYRYFSLIGKENL